MDRLSKQMLTDVGYILLYKFLRKERILSNYINNIIYQNSAYKKDNAKTILKRIAKAYPTRYTIRYNFGCGFVDGGFWWSTSFEGSDYWIPYGAKYQKFVSENLNKYENLWNIGHTKKTSNI